MADAVYFIHQHAKEYGGDPGKIILAGDSGGAHLASWYAAGLAKKEALFFSQEKYPDAEHAFLNFYKKSCAQEAMGKAQEFMKRCYAGAVK